MFILISSIILALGFGATSAFTFWKVTEGYQFYRPILIALSGFAIMILFWMLFIDVFGNVITLKKKYNKFDKKISTLLLRDGIHFITVISLTKVKIHGKSRLPKNGEKFLLVCNHRSNFDPLITYALFKDTPLAFITKQSNFKIPLGGKLMKVVDFQGVDRSDPLQSLEVMNRCANLVSNDVCSIAVYPEGTRIHEKEMGPFHEGVFSIATKAHCPIVICTITATDKIHENYPRKFTKIHLDVVRTMYPEEFIDRPVKEISDEARELMTLNLARYHE